MKVDYSHSKDMNIARTQGRNIECDWVNNDSGNGLVPDGTKPLPG